MIETLLIAAPPAPEPGPNYLELIGIPLLVALVTAVVTSMLNNLRTRSDRLAALRVETYRELVLLANRWETAVSESIDALARGEANPQADQRVGQLADRLSEQVHLLPLVARRRSTEAIRDTFVATSDVMLRIEKAKSPGEKRQVADASEAALRRFVNTIIREGHREIRRTGV